VCSVDDVPLHEGRTVRVGGRPLAVFRSEGGFHVLDNACPHLGGPLADGLLADSAVTCPLHERRFDLRSGEPLGHDCRAVETYPVTVAGGEVFVGSAHGARPPLVVARPADSRPRAAAA
jgi:nitrite reductase (NADH) small subunit